MLKQPTRRATTDLYSILEISIGHWTNRSLLRVWKKWQSILALNPRRVHSHGCMLKQTTRHASDLYSILEISIGHWTNRSLLRVWKKWQSILALNPRRVHSHSPRIVGVSARTGGRDSIILDMGCWKSFAFLTYLRPTTTLMFLVARYTVLRNDLIILDKIRHMHPGLFYCVNTFWYLHSKLHTHTCQFDNFKQKLWLNISV